jgi:CHAD domain-containing protein
VNRFRELEVEARALDRPGLERIATALLQDGASALAPVPKVVRVLGAKAALPPDVFAPAELSPLDPAARAVQAAIATGVQRVLMNDPTTRLGEVEPLHQMRVGARRLRSDLRLFAPLIDRGWADGLRTELRWLGQALGQVRDLDVMLARLRGAAAGFEEGLEPLFDELEQRHRAARQDLLVVLRSRRYLDLLDALVAAANDPPITAMASEQSQTALPPLAEKAWSKLASEVRSLSPGDPDERYHQVRILAKRSRYAAEAVAPALGADRGRRALRFARRAANVQDVLGTLQDTAVAREIVHEVVGRRPKDGTFAVAAGRLIERQEQAARDARAGFAKAWQKLDRSKQRAWLTK